MIERQDVPACLLNPGGRHTRPPIGDDVSVDIGSDSAPIRGRFAIGGVADAGYTRATRGTRRNFMQIAPWQGKSMRISNGMRLARGIGYDLMRVGSPYALKALPTPPRFRGKEPR
ncbi:hypothetical protein BGC_35180 [Burkholderia sp. 3C]